MLRVRYMPYSYSELGRFRILNGYKPNFDRSGNVNSGLGYWLSFVFGLGGQSNTTARWALLLSLAMVCIRLKRRVTAGP